MTTDTKAAATDKNASPDNYVDEAKQVFKQARDGLLEMRLTGLGLIEKANTESKNRIESIKKRSEAHKQSHKQDASSDETAASFYQKALANLEASLQGVRAISNASYEEISETSQQISDWVTKAFNEAGTEVESKTDKPISRVSRSIEQVTHAFNRLAKEARETSETLLNEAKEHGADVDYEMRKAIFGRQASLEERIQAFWSALGLVNKQEMEEVNRKLVLLAESLENQLDEDSKSLVYLNRRKKDRRVKQQPVKLDKRIRDRREEDRGQLAS